MAERIEQQFLIDAAAAIQTLQQLDQGFQTFEKRLNSVAQSVQNFNNGIKGNASAVTSYNRAVQSTANAINRSNQGTKQLINTSAGLSNINAQYGQIIGNLAEMYDRSKKFGITLETLSRVALTQALVRGYNSARDAIAEATREAAAFEQKVALISTIAQGTGNEAIAKGVKDIAGQFNIPLLETAEGVYNALSNQVGKFGETLEFTAEAAKFAKATNSSLADSVDLLSAVLNSYGLTARDTNRVASILFTTIDEGRVVASELGNSMGRILPSATQLGVTMEETAAAIALISQQGLNSAETLTRVNAMFTTLLKPSEALKERYKQLDVASGEMGIRTFGLAKFLDMLTKSGTMASAELSKLAPNIRGFGGIVGVTSKGPEAFADAIERVNKAVANDKATEAYTKATATNAEVVSRAFQNGKLALEEYGEFIVDTFADAVRAVDSFTEDNQAAIDTVETVVASFVGMGTSLGATTIGIFAAANAMRALNFVMIANPALGVVAAFGALTGATLAYIEQAKRAKIDAALEKFHKAEEASTKRLAEVTKQAAQTFDESYSKIRTSVGGLLYAAAPAKKQYDQTISDIIRQNTKLEDSTDLALDRVVDARRKYVSELSQAAQDADDQVRRSQQQIASLRAGQADRTFGASLTGLSDSAQVLKLTQQAASLASKAAADL
ncbi:MAG: phage tail tape measure protein, partial [Aureliella sp.]